MRPTGVSEVAASCEVVFLGGERFSLTGDEGIELGRWCFKKDKVKKGKC